MRRVAFAMLGLGCSITLVACGSSDTNSASSVCAKIEESGVGANCSQEEPAGLGIGATEKYAFDLPSVPGEGGQVLIFDDANTYEKTVEAYAEMASLAGPHRYGNEEALVFVQINEGLSTQDGETVKSIVDNL